METLQRGGRDSHESASGASRALPGPWIVAAVLRIVVTMQHLDGPAEELAPCRGRIGGNSFLGLLRSYGSLQPVAAILRSWRTMKDVLLQLLKQA